jgi:hypothetical protein
MKDVFCPAVRPNAVPLSGKKSPMAPVKIVPEFGQV